MIDATGRVTRIEWLTEVLRARLSVGSAKDNEARGALWDIRPIPANQLCNANDPSETLSRFGDSGRVSYELAALGDVVGYCDSGNGEGDGREKGGEELHDSKEYRSEGMW